MHGLFRVLFRSLERHAGTLSVSLHPTTYQESWPSLPCCLLLSTRCPLPLGLDDLIVHGLHQIGEDRGGERELLAVHPDGAGIAGECEFEVGGSVREGLEEAGLQVRVHREGMIESQNGPNGKTAKPAKNRRNARLRVSQPPLRVSQTALLKTP